MADPQAQGGTAFSFTGSQPPTDAGYKPADSNIVQVVDVTKVANDQPNDRDYDDAYPGGGTKGADDLLLT